MRWTLIEENDIKYFRFRWQNHSALYSIKPSDGKFLKEFKPIFLKQIHSDIIVDVDRQGVGFGDGLMSKSINCALGIKVADCLPVYFFSGKKICILHCGWRGIMKGIVKSAAKFMGDYKYSLGASIGPCCYEVKDDVAKLFNKKYTNATISRDKKYFLDLKAAVIEDLGAGNLVGSLDLCTKCHPEYFYSHRRGDTKRNYGVLKAV